MWMSANEYPTECKTRKCHECEKLAETGTTEAQIAARSYLARPTSVNKAKRASQWLSIRKKRLRSHFFSIFRI